MLQGCLYSSMTGEAHVRILPPLPGSPAARLGARTQSCSCLGTAFDQSDAIAIGLRRVPGYHEVPDNVRPVMRTLVSGNRSRGRDVAQNNRLGLRPGQERRFAIGRQNEPRFHLTVVPESSHLH